MKDDIGYASVGKELFFRIRKEMSLLHDVTIGSGGLAAQRSILSIARSLANSGKISTGVVNDIRYQVRRNIFGHLLASTLTYYFRLTESLGERALLN